MKKYKKSLVYISLVLGIIFLAIIIKHFSDQKFYEQNHYPRFLDKKEVTVGFGSTTKYGVYDSDALVDLKDFQITDENDYYYTIYSEKPTENRDSMEYDADFGHSFIALSSISKKKPVNETVVVVGFYPETNITMKDVILGTDVKGTLKNDNYHKYTNYCSFKFSAEEMKRMKQTLEQLQTDVETGNIKYNAEKYNSSTMVAELIKQSNLEILDLNEKTWGDKAGEIITFKQKSILNNYNRYLKNKKGFTAFHTDSKVEDYSKRQSGSKFDLMDFLRALE